MALPCTPRLAGMLGDRARPRSQTTAATATAHTCSMVTPPKNIVSTTRLICPGVRVVIFRTPASSDALMYIRTALENVRKPPKRTSFLHDLHATRSVSRVKR